VSQLRLAYVLAGSAGGTVRHVAMLARACAAQGAQVAVFGPAGLAAGLSGQPSGTCPAGSAAATGDRAGAEHDGKPWAGSPPGRPGVAAFTAVEIGSRPRPARDVAAVRRLRQLLAAERPCVVHAHGLRSGAAAALAIGTSARSRDRPALVVTVHNAPPRAAAAAASYAMLERIVARRSDAVLCVSADLADRMRRRGARNTGLAVVAAPQAPPSERGAVLALRASLGAGRPVLLAAGRLAPQKGFATVLDAAVSWQQHDPVPVLVIAGSGPLRSRLADRARRRGIAVRFLGQRDDVPALLAAADVVIVPSWWEGQPLIVQEALRAGRPVVASRVGGIPALAGGAAVLVPPGDPAALARAVSGLLDDPGLAARLAAAARRRAADLPTESDAIGAAMRLYQLLAPVSC
jgi:glycosyltransferase involved in cell wall biosynthesis